VTSVSAKAKKATPLLSCPSASCHEAHEGTSIELLQLFTIGLIIHWVHINLLKHGGTLFRRPRHTTLELNSGIFEVVLANVKKRHLGDRIILVAT
jgi:hypothetical protein